MDQNNNIDPDQMRQFNEELSNLTGSSQDLDKAFAQLSKSISTMAGSAATSSKSMATAAPAIASVSSGVNRAMDDLNKLNQKYAASGDKLDKFTDSLTKGISNINQTMGKFALDLGKGNTSFSMLNGIIDSVSGALSGMAKSIPLFGGMLSGSITAAASAAKFLVDMLEKNLKVFQDLSRSGALVADGMSGVNRQFYASGMTMEGFTKTIKANADALASFKGTVGAGAEVFTSAVGKLTKQSDSALRKLGMTADDIGESAGLFLQQEIRLGRARNMTEEQLVKGTEKYAKELDALQKITGESKEALAKRQEQLQSDARFGLMMQEESAKGNTQGAEALQKFILQFKNPEMAAGLRDMSTGITGATEASRKMILTYGTGAEQLVDDIKNRRISVDEGNRRMSVLLEAGAQLTNQSTKILGANQAYFDSTASMLQKNALQGKSLDKANQTRNDQIKSDDALTKSAISAQQNMEKMSQEIFKMGSQLLPGAASAIELFTDKLVEAIEYIENKFLGKSSKNTAPSGAAPMGETAGGAATGNSNLTRQSARYRNNKEKTELAANGRTTMENDERLIGRVSGGERVISDLVNFGPNTGSREHFLKLNPEVSNAFTQMAGEYFDLTGKKLNINSSFRSLEEQKNVNSGGNPKAEPGKSKHNFGKALDLNSSDVIQLQMRGLLEKYKFNTVPGDGPHIEMARFGGVFDGPSSGYPVMLHGRETVIPEGLSFAGKENILQQVQKSSLPSDMSNNVTNTRSDMSVDMIAELYNLMSEKLDDMVSKLTTSNQIQDQLLRYSRT
jgi:methyl-accepting chemotaxis protein/uncharacterized protein YcbK (DUF882 family)